MLTIDAMHVLSLLLDMDTKSARQAARGLLKTADVSHLWTIARCAAILDTHAPRVARVKLDAFAESLADQRREIVEFIAENTGDRPRRTVVDLREARNPLSVWFDTRPGFDDHDAQPTGLTVHPENYQEQRTQQKAATMAALARTLRDSPDQLPPHVRTAIRETVPTTNPQARRAPAPVHPAVADYMATRLNVEDRTATGMRTIFDIDDDQPRAVALNVMAPAIAQIKTQITTSTAQTHTTQPTMDQPDTVTTPGRRTRNAEIHDPMHDTDVPLPGYEFDYAKAAVAPLRTTPCVWCWCERTPTDHRATRPASPATTPRHDDGLCRNCRADNRPGLPQQPTTPPGTVRTVAYLNPHARKVATQAAAATSLCAAVAEHLPTAAALVWLRTHYRLAPEAHRPAITAWVAQWLNTHRPQPQPPAPNTPAVPAQAPALTAA